MNVIRPYFTRVLNFAKEWVKQHTTLSAYSSGLILFVCAAYANWEFYDSLLFRIPVVLGGLSLVGYNLWLAKELSSDISDFIVGLRVELGMLLSLAILFGIFGWVAVGAVESAYMPECKGELIQELSEPYEVQECSRYGCDTHETSYIITLCVNDPEFPTLAKAARNKYGFFMKLCFIYILNIMCIVWRKKNGNLNPFS